MIIHSMLFRPASLQKMSETRFPDELQSSRHGSQTNSTTLRATVTTRWTHDCRNHPKRSLNITNKCSTAATIRISEPPLLPLSYEETAIAKLTMPYCDRGPGPVGKGKTVLPSGTTVFPSPTGLEPVSPPLISLLP